MSGESPLSAHVVYIAPVFEVRDLSRSVAFYRDRLGFDVEFIHDGFYASVICAGGRIHLKCSGTPAGVPAATDAAEHIDACIGIADAAALYSRLVANQVPFSVPLRQMPYGQEFYIRDPDGHVVAFVQPAQS